MGKIVKETIHAKSIDIGIYTTNEFLGVWEELHNPEFNRMQFEAVKNEAGLNRFVMTPTKWITQMNAIGIISKAGLSIRILQGSFIVQAILKAGDEEFKKSVMLVRILELMSQYILFMAKTSW